MGDDQFELLDRMLTDGEAGDAFEHLAQTFRKQQNYPMLFETRLMKARREVGLPLISSGSDNEPPPEVRARYEKAFFEAARETGSLYLGDGLIARAWPYFRAIGETGPIADALDKAEPDGDLDALIEIAFHERVNPRRGFELVLRRHGLCRAISYFEQYPVPSGREESLKLLVHTLYEELVERLTRTITQAEGTPPQHRGVRELITGRDWLFGEHDYYVDTSHLVSVLRFGIGLEDRDTLLKMVELTEYGQRLSPMFHFRGEPPFENTYEDYGKYLKALAGECVEEAIEHFRSKLESGDPAVAQSLILLLTRLHRHSEAIKVSRAYLRDVPASELACPSAVQLCQLAGDFRQLRDIARQQDDVLTYAAALIEERESGSARTRLPCAEK